VGTQNSFCARPGAVGPIAPFDLFFLLVPDSLDLRVREVISQPAIFPKGGPTYILISLYPLDAVSASVLALFSSRPR